MNALLSRTLISRIASRSFLGVALLALAACARTAAPGSNTDPAAGEADTRAAVTLTLQESGTDALLVGADAVTGRVAWASGTGGTVLRTTDGGQTWARRDVPGADSLQFRDVEAMSARVAYVLSIGPGADSRIYKTTDGGATWTLQFTNDDPEAFFDCMAFWDERTGFVFSDAVPTGPDSPLRLPVAMTTDGGTSWTRLPPERLPRAFPGEGSFAASGTCAAAYGTRLGWIGTGNAPGRPARVFRTADRGQTWQAAPVPLDGGAGAGVASVLFRSKTRGLALGGDIGQPTRTDSAAARTTDGGRTWQRAAGPPFDGPVYGAAYVPGLPATTVVAVGPGGAGYSVDGARSWEALGDSTYWSAAFADPRTQERRGARPPTVRGWLVGPRGRIALVRFRQ